MMLQYKPLHLEVSECVIKLLLCLGNGTDNIFAFCQMLFIHHMLFLDPYVSPYKHSEEKLCRPYITSSSDFVSTAMSIYKQLYRLMSDTIMQYEYLINIYECVYIFYGYTVSNFISLLLVTIHLLKQCHRTVVSIFGRALKPEIYRGLFI